MTARILLLRPLTLLECKCSACCLVVIGHVVVLFRIEYQPGTITLETDPKVPTTGSGREGGVKG